MKVNYFKILLIDVTFYRSQFPVVINVLINILKKNTNIIGTGG